MERIERFASLMDDAVNRAEVEEVRSLLDEGVPPDIRDVVGDTPLINAAWIGAPEVVMLLLERGANVNAMGSDGKTALQRLLGNNKYWHTGHDQVVCLLRNAGAWE